MLPKPKVIQFEQDIPDSFNFSFLIIYHPLPLLRKGSHSKLMGQLVDSN